MSAENDNLNISNDRDDPFAYLFTHERSNNDIKEEISPNGNTSYKINNLVNVEESFIQPESNGLLNKEGYKYDYGYTITLTYQNEDGLMDTYLNEANNESDKPREDPSDWFNFGFNEEKWMKFLNKSILMHYERNLLQQQMNPEMNKNLQNVNPQFVNPQFVYPSMGSRPMMPGAMPGYPQTYPYPMYRWPHPAMMYPPMNVQANIPHGSIESLKNN